MIEICSLGSSSRGNSFFIRTGNDLFLVDAGLSCRKICSGIKELGYSPEDLTAVWITHEHSDHIKGLPVFLKKNRLPVFMTRATFIRSKLKVDPQLIREISPEQKITIHNTDIEILLKSHDAVEPCLFSFYYKQSKSSFITDAGWGCPNVIRGISGADNLVIEANHDPNMLINGNYPRFLKSRIKSNHGHLSNFQAADLVRKYAENNLKHLLLAHLSLHNNSPGLVRTLFQETLAARNSNGGAQMEICPAEGISKRFRLE